MIKLNAYHTNALAILVARTAPRRTALKEFNGLPQRVLDDLVAQELAEHRIEQVGARGASSAMLPVSRFLVCRGQETQATIHGADARMRRRHHRGNGRPRADLA